jgi:hypothetical protein
MSLLKDSPRNVTVTFSLPPVFIAPLDGKNETVIDIQVVNAQQPVNVKNWKQPAIVDGQWNFSFPHRYDGVSVKYRIRIQMFHDERPLLLEQDYFVIVHRAPYHQTLHLSPIGYLYVEVQSPQAIASEQAVTISLHEKSNPELELARVSHDEQTATSFYLRYDPDQAVPGKHYALTGIENRYHQQVSVSPGPVELVPLPTPISSRLVQAFQGWLKDPLRLFTDSLPKIR